MRNVPRIKLGYYPLPQEEGKRPRKLLDFSIAPASVVDPCVGTGDALHQLTDGTSAQRHGVELDANRAAAGTACGITTIRGDLFNTIAKLESFSFLYLNPPAVENSFSGNSQKLHRARMPYKRLSPLR